MNKNAVFAIGVIGGLVGYACGVLATPGTAAAQQQGSNNGGDQTPAHDGGSTPTDPLPTTPPPPACKQWEVKVLPEIVYPSYGVFTVPEGWEPFSYNGGSGSVIVRRCIR